MTKQDIVWVEEIASMIGVTKNTIQRKKWRDKTGCPIRKKGKKLYCIRTELDSWLKG